MKTKTYFLPKSHFQKLSFFSRGNLYYLLLPLKSSETYGFSHDFEGTRDLLMRLNLPDNSCKIWWLIWCFVNFLDELKLEDKILNGLNPTKPPQKLFVPVFWYPVYRDKANERLCKVWYHLYNLKNVKNAHGVVLLLVKLQAWACNFTKSKPSPWVLFIFFKILQMVPIRANFNIIRNKKLLSRASFKS